MKRLLLVLGILFVVVIAAVSLRRPWFLIGTDGQTIVREHIKPKQIIAVHISPSESDKTTTQIKQAFPGAVAFTTMLEKRSY